MKKNNELEKQDLAVDPDIQLDCDIGQELLVYLETWFDVDRKFGLHLAEDDSSWLNMYARFNPFADTLHIECEIDTDDWKENRTFPYDASDQEAVMIKELITEKVKEIYGLSPKEFCTEFFEGEITMGGIE